MSEKEKMNRRAALKIGLAALAGTGSVANAANAEVTPKQTEGPFFPTKDQDDKDRDMTMIQGNKEAAKGDVIYLTGQVVDQNGDPVEGALVDIWQANAAGRYHHERDTNPAKVDPNFQGWCQLKTDAKGNYNVKTIKPGAYPATKKWWRPPHIHFKVAKRGYIELTTQLYFEGEKLNDKDGIYQRLGKDGQKMVTVKLGDGPKDDPKAKSGHFKIVIEKV